MSNEKIRVGIIGIGMYAVLVHLPQLRNTGKAEVVAISRRNPRALADAKESFMANKIKSRRAIHEHCFP